MIKDFEVVDFVATTRRWYDKGNMRDAGGCYARQSLIFHQRAVE